MHQPYHHGQESFHFEEDLARWRAMVAGRCHLAAVLVLVHSVALAFLGFAFLSNLTVTHATGDLKTFRNWDLVGFDLYFILAFFSGIFIGMGMDTRVLRHRTLARVLLMIPGVVVLSTLMVVYVVPVLRGVLAVMPLLGLSLTLYSFASWPFSGVGAEGLARLRKLLILESLLCLGIVGLFELGLYSGRWLAAAVLYPAILVGGCFVAAAGLGLRDAVGGSLRAGAGAFPGRAAPLDSRDGADLAASFHRESRLSRRQATMLSFFIIAMVPCVAVLASPADLDIVYAGSARNESINVTIVNRGGQAAEEVELWGDGERLATIGRIEGFGVWDGVHVKGHPARLVVKAGGRDMDAGSVFYPSGCDLIFLALGITAVGKALPTVLKKR